MSDQEEIMRLRKALERIASMEAFDVSRVIDPEKDKELLARITYARRALNE